MEWPKLQKIVFFAFIIAIVGSFSLFQFLGYDIASENIRIQLKEFGLLSPIIFIIIYTIGAIFIPSTPFKIIAGLFFGFQYGLFLVMVGGLLSSIIVFHISRKLGKEWVEKILEHRYLTLLNKYNKRLETGAVWDVILLRITPVMPLNILSVLLGISRINERDYTIGTFVGLLPSATLTVYLGTLLTKIF